MPQTSVCVEQELSTWRGEKALRVLAVEPDPPYPWVVCARL
jgi:hypothetical protein